MAKLYFYYSTMNAGKSTSLLQSSHNYRERGMRTLVYTAGVDQRALAETTLGGLAERHLANRSNKVSQGGGVKD